jgi:hypothetical protein
MAGPFLPSAAFRCCSAAAFATASPFCSQAAAKVMAALWRHRLVLLVLLVLLAARSQPRSNQQLAGLKSAGYQSINATLSWRQRPDCEFQQALCRLAHEVYGTLHSSTHSPLQEIERADSWQLWNVHG